MRKYTVYSAGAIKGLTIDEATSWRDELRKMIHPEVDVRSPMRYKKNELPKDTPLDQPGMHYEGLFTSQRAIVTRDRVDCTTADIIVMNLMGAEIISLGSMVEIGWADAFRIPIILIMEPEGNIHEHFFTAEIPSWRVQTVKDAARVVHALLNLPDTLLSV